MQPPCFQWHPAFYCSFHQVHLVPLTSDKVNYVSTTPSTWQVKCERQLYQTAAGTDNWVKSVQSNELIRRHICINYIPFYCCLLDVLQGNDIYLPVILSVRANCERVDRKYCDRILVCSRVDIQECADERAKRVVQEVKRPLWP